MAGGRRITPAEIQHYWALKAQGLSQRRAAMEAGFSYDSAKLLERDRTTRGGGTRHHDEGGTRPKLHTRASLVVPEFVVHPDHWPQAAKDALADRTGQAFCQRYLGMTLSPWQMDMWEGLEDAWASNQREYLMVNAPPGLGKSTVLVGFGAKRTAMNRDIRGLFMSRSYSLAERNTNRLRRVLDRASPFVDASSCLGVDFGRFRPVVQDVWRRGEFVVEQFDGQPIEEKEPTWAAFGFDSEWIGNRLDLLFGDDLDTKKSIRNIDIVEANRETFDGELEPRIDAPKRLIDPVSGEVVGGVLGLAQQRLGAFDFSAHVLTKRVLPLDDGDDVELDDEFGELKYRQVIYKAHYEDKCLGKETHAHDSPAYPVGCLLDPRQLGWRDCRIAMKDERNWAIVYQQEDVAEAEALVKREWITGGTAQDGRYYMGCWDKDRPLWKLPEGLAGQTHGYITVDPSPTRYWGVQAWVYHPVSEQRFLLDLNRSKMDAPEFLDWSSDMKCFTGLAEDWWQNFQKTGVKLSHVIVEVNAAQRFMLQYDHFHRWMRLRGVQVVAHSTGRNKADEDYGVEMLGPLYRDGKIRLPGAGFSRMTSQKLVDEVTRYPSSSTDDQVMSQWFGEYSLTRHLFVPADSGSVVKWRPTWMKGTDAA